MGSNPIPVTKVKAPRFERIEALLYDRGAKETPRYMGNAHEGVSAPSRKHILHKSHVKDRAGGHGEHHLPFPEVEQRGHKEGDGFRDTVIS